MEDMEIVYRYGEMLEIYANHPVAPISQLPSDRKTLGHILINALRETRDRTERSIIEGSYLDLAKFVPEPVFDLFLLEEKLEEKLKSLQAGDPDLDQAKADLSKVQAETQKILLDIKSQKATLYQRVKLVSGQIASLN